jgi:pyruvate kinase
MKILARSRQLDGKKINTTLIATIGPSSDSKETIKQLLAAGR